MGHDHHEVVSTQTKKHVGEVGLAEQGGESTQDFIAAQMSLFIIDDRELVDIKHGERERFTVALSLFQGTSKVFLKSRMIAQASKGVGERDALVSSDFGQGRLIKFLAITPLHREGDPDEQQANDERDGDSQQDHLLDPVELYQLLFGDGLLSFRLLSEFPLDLIEDRGDFGRTDDACTCDLSGINRGK